MKNRLLLIFFTINIVHLFSISLKQVYDEAMPFGMYDRYLELENGIPSRI